MFARTKPWLIAAAVAAALTAAGPATAQVQPYGTNDAGGFRNVLPPGAAGVDNAAELAAFLATGAYPNHWNDQQPLYDGLIGASANGISEAELGTYYKDATFGVQPDDVESSISPREGVTIVRDSIFGVPHIYGGTRADTMFGVGYASAQDRLFLMDVLRHTARAQLSSFVGGSEGNREMDRVQWGLAPYTEADLLEQVRRAEELYGQAGVRLIEDVEAYVDGINAYIERALALPTLLPAEYAAIGKLPVEWRVTDVIAEASLIGGIFSVGGGAELDNALLAQQFERRFGRAGGRRLWAEFRARDDAEAPTTVSERFPYLTNSAFSPRGLAIPDRGSVERTFVGPPLEEQGSPAGAAGSGALGDIGSQLLDVLGNGGHASNWLMVSGEESATGRPIGVLGPQVGYYVPQVLMEQDVHGPGIDARGAAFPGTNLFVQLGHGRDYAWSATTAISDHIDTFAEVLCRNDFHYRYRGRCIPMEKLERTNTWTPNALDMTPTGSETLTAYRTVHGIVVARGEVDGREVAFARARSTYGHEADSALFFSRMNDPHYMRDGAESFYRAIRGINFSFNWAYIDEHDIAYHLSGWYPQRPRGVSPDFPILGTGRFDWRGWDPDTRTADWLPTSRIPNALNPPFAISWNNKQAPGWAAADDNYAFGPLQRMQLLERHVRSGVRGARKMTLGQLVHAMEEPATEDLRAVKLLPTLLRALGPPRSAEVRSAVGPLRQWFAAGGHRRDLDGDGHYEHEAAIVVMDAWWPLLVEAVFRPVLGPKLFDALAERLALGDHTRAQPNPPDFFGGWWGYVSKDLRSLLGQRVRDPFSRQFCGRGSLGACRAALQASLRRALAVSPATLYGAGGCADEPEPDCYDQNRSVIASGISTPPMPFQNRPTFQQTVELHRGVPTG